MNYDARNHELKMQTTSNSESELNISRHIKWTYIYK